MKSVLKKRSKKRRKAATKFPFTTFLVVVDLNFLVKSTKFNDKHNNKNCKQIKCSKIKSRFCFVCKKKIVYHLAFYFPKTNISDHMNSFRKNKPFSKILNPISIIQHLRFISMVKFNLRLGYFLAVQCSST